MRLERRIKMKKDYQKPEVEFVSLVAQEEITTDDYVEGEMGLESSIFD